MLSIATAHETLEFDVDNRSQSSTEKGLEALIALPGRPIPTHVSSWLGKPWYGIAWELFSRVAGVFPGNALPCQKPSHDMDSEGDH